MSTSLLTFVLLTGLLYSDLKPFFANLARVPRSFGGGVIVATVGWSENDKPLSLPLIYPTNHHSPLVCIHTFYASPAKVIRSFFNNVRLEHMYIHSYIVFRRILLTFVYSDTYCICFHTYRMFIGGKAVRILCSPRKTSFPPFSSFCQQKLP